jgi:hypothetical protein
MKRYCFAIIFFLILISCSNFQNRTQINEKSKLIVVYYNGCNDDAELISDLSHSFESNKSFFEKNKIIVQIDTIQKKCGYLFKLGKKEIVVESIMTDIDLENFTKHFFKIQ